MDLILQSQSQFASWADFGGFTGGVLLLAFAGSWIFAEIMTSR